MSDLMITDGVKQTVITRLSTINAAISLLNLTNGKPAKLTVNEVLNLAEQLEQWAWRELLDDNTKPREPEKPISPEEPAKPALSKVEGAKSEPAAEKSDRPQPRPSSSNPNGHGQSQGGATEKQINALFAIGKSKGFDSNGVIGWVKEQSRKSITALTSREASKLIGDLQAL